MKKITALILLAVALGLTSCASVYVAADYDSQADFSAMKTFAFFKEGVDKVQISDLDKKRILRAIEQNLKAKGMTLSEQPDFLVNIFTHERENVDVYDNSPYYWGWGWGPYWGYPNYNISRSTEGVLYIEIIDAKKRELIWQGKGAGVIPRSPERKQEAIQNFVNKILEKYPPK